MSRVCSCCASFSLFDCLTFDLGWRWWCWWWWQRAQDFPTHDYEKFMPGKRTSTRKQLKLGNAVRADENVMSYINIESQLSHFKICLDVCLRENRIRVDRSAVRVRWIISPSVHLNSPSTQPESALLNRPTRQTLNNRLLIFISIVMLSVNYTSFEVQCCWLMEACQTSGRAAYIPPVIISRRWRDCRCYPGREGAKARPGQPPSSHS